ncbi:MAG TPA: alpha/beta hydrolase [Pyrinomonadaceae bacterium]|nr:alpha/beta hydrolase [Pyrinomonadaceae bacterium]
MKKRYLFAGLSGVVAAAFATKLLIRPRDVNWEESRDVVFHAEHSRFVAVDGVRIHYQEAGERDAPAMILIHGFASSTLVWSKVLLELAAEGFRVITPDLAGFGYSGKPRHLDYTIGSQARMIVGLLDALKIDQAIIIGSSYGAAVASTVALDHPDRVQKLILVGAVTNNNPTRYLLMRLFSSPVIGDIVSPLLLGSRRLLRRRMKRVYDRHSWVLDERRVDARHLPLRAASTHRAIVRTVRRWDADRISRDAHLLKQPTLILWGENDREVPLRDGQLLLDKIHGSRLVIFRDCGHLPHEEFPLEFTEIVSDFCADKRAKLRAVVG